MAKTTVDAKTEAAETTIKALYPIEHDGERHEPGEVFSLPAKAAQALVDCGAAEVSQ